jgi:hypothetical protein
VLREEEKIIPIAETTIAEEVTPEIVQEVAETPVIDYAQIMEDNFIRRVSAYVFIDRCLKVRYPERFTDENLLATIEFLVDYLADKTDVEIAQVPDVPLPPAYRGGPLCLRPKAQSSKSHH